MDTNKMTREEIAAMMRKIDASFWNTKEGRKVIRKREQNRRSKIRCAYRNSK